MNVMTTAPTAGYITATGHYDLTNEEYHGNCCAGPSLSNSSIKALLADPSEYWRESPLNPQRVEREQKKAFNVGTTAHTMVLEPELVQETIAVIPNDMLASNGALSTKAAKTFLAEQTKLGRTVVKQAEWEAVCDMADEIRSNEVIMRALSGGLPEQSLIVKDEETGIFLKSRPDYMPTEDGRFIVDLKTTDRPMIGDWERTATVDLRYDMQAAMMLWATELVTGIRPAGVMFVVSCKQAPYRVAVRTIRPNSDTGRALLDAGWDDIRKGVNIFAECWDSQRWPSPWDSISDVTAPEWRMRQIEKQLEASSTSSPFGEIAA